MPATYEPIATTTLGSATNSINFTSIPSTYTDLVIILVGTVSVAAVPCIRFNSDTGTNYSGTNIAGNGTGAVSSRSVGDTQIFSNFTQNFSTTVPGLLQIDIFSYAGSTNKSVFVRESRDENGFGLASSLVGLWRNTSAITSINLRPESQNWKIGTTATLYGILRA